MQPGEYEQLMNQQNHVTHVSRLQCIFSAIENQLEQIKKLHPSKKIGLITFSN
jgi:hypothetical protein